MEEPSISFTAGLWTNRRLSNSGKAYGTDTSVWVLCQDVNGAARALQRAGRRFRHVTDDGVEHPDDASWFDLLVTRPDLDSPTDVSGVFAVPGGVAMVMDWEDSYWPDVAPTMIEILRQELIAAGVVDAEVRSLPDELAHLQTGEKILPAL